MMKVTSGFPDDARASPISDAPRLRPVDGESMLGLPRHGRTRLKKPVHTQRHQQLYLASWNVRTLLDNDRSDRPERRKALVARELARYSIDVAALSETRLAEEGQLTELQGGYTFYWIGKTSPETRTSGVGFAVRTNIVKKLTSLPRGISDRIMVLRLPLAKKRHATLISVYAPTMMYTDDEKDQFYATLSECIDETPPTDQIILLGDFNARVGSDWESWPKILGKFGIGKMNSNGQLLLELCRKYQLNITNSNYDTKESWKTTWQHPRSKNWHLLDYVIVRQKDRQEVKYTRAMPGAECWTDHRMVRTKIKLRIEPRHPHANKRTSTAINTDRLKFPDTLVAFQEDVTNRLQNEGSVDEEPDVEYEWSNLRSALLTAANNHLGKPRRKHEDWFDENDDNIHALLEQKHKTHRALLSGPKTRVKVSLKKPPEPRCSEHLEK